MPVRPCTNIEEDLKPIERNGLLYYEHGTRITVVCLMPNHPALKSPIESITFFQKNACLIGKGKKGACKVEGRSRLCEIKNTDGTSHVIRYGISGTLIEGNGRLLNDPELLRKSPTYEGFLGIILASSKPKESITIHSIE
uniref:Protein Abitram n=1 Tax=Panagrolaimus sp. ES5 TaxID=591445 RepID=A0AC34GS68_9BILA